MKALLVFLVGVSIASATLLVPGDQLLPAAIGGALMGAGIVIMVINWIADLNI